MNLFRFSLVTLLTFSSFASWAQGKGELTLNQRTPATEEAKTPGWTPSLTLQGNLSFGSNDNVIGQQDGDTVTLGTNSTGGYSYWSEKQEWRNSLKFSAATTRTPTIPRYVKSNDELKLESLYFYSLEAYPWLGPYVRFRAETTAFKGEDVRDQPVSYIYSNGRASTTTATVRLTDPFKPLTTRESFGAFAKIITEETLTLEAALGLGAMQVAAGNQFSLSDDPLTPAIELKELKTYNQAGLEGGFNFKGIIDSKTSYSLTGDFLVPVIKDLEPGDKRNTLELTNYELVAKLTSKITSWASLDYEYKIKKQPQLLDKEQIQHLMLMNLTYTIF